MKAVCVSIRFAIFLILIPTEVCVLALQCSKLCRRFDPEQKQRFAETACQGVYASIEMVKLVLEWNSCLEAREWYLQKLMGLDPGNQFVGISALIAQRDRWPLLNHSQVPDVFLSKHLLTQSSLLLWRVGGAKAGSFPNPLSYPQECKSLFSMQCSSSAHNQEGIQGCLPRTEDLTCNSVLMSLLSIWKALDPTHGRTTSLQSCPIRFKPQFWMMRSTCKIYPWCAVLQRRWQSEWELQVWGPLSLTYRQLTNVAHTVHRLQQSKDFSTHAWAILDW